MLVFGAMNASAQLTVYHNGNVNIGSEQPTSNVSLSVGNVAYSDTAYHVSLGLHNPASGCYNIGGEGVAYSPTTRNTGRAFGLRGVGSSRQLHKRLQLWRAWSLARQSGWSSYLWNDQRQDVGLEC